MIDNLEIVIVGNKRKEIITAEFLKDIPYRIFYTTDYDLPKDFRINSKYLIYVSAFKNMLGAYRCFRGHQDALKSCTKENILVFEDDAVPNRGDWLEVVSKSIKMLEQFEIVSLHGRKVDFSLFNCIDKDDLKYFYKKNINRDVKVYGSLCYLINKKTIDKVIQDEYEGYPMDMYISNRFSYCLLNPSPFNHDRKMGSLVEEKK